MISPGALASSPAVRPFYDRAPTGAAPVPPSFVSSATGSVSNPASLGANPSFTVGPLAILAGDLLVVAVGTMGGLAEPTVTVDGGGAPVTTEDVTIQSGLGVRAAIFQITGAAAGNRTITVTGPGLAGLTPSGMGAVAYVLRGAAAVPFDKSASTSGNDVGPFVVGPTAALASAGQFDIAALALNTSNDGTEVPTPWAAPFVDRAHAGPAFDPGDDVTLFCADTTSLTTAAVTATSGAIPDSTEFAIVVATFKGA